MSRRFPATWVLPLVVAAPMAWAQPAPGDPKPDPQDARASVPQVNYRSPLANYRVLSDEKVTSWKGSNDNVGRIGGWRAYAKEAQQPTGDSTPLSTDKPAPADGTKPMQDGAVGRKTN